MKIGAFRFAVKNNVPVVPMFIQFRKSRVRRAVGVTPAVTVQVLPPLYGNPDLPVRERAEDLRLRTEAAYRAQYEKYYKKKLTYLSEEDAADDAGAGNAEEGGAGNAAAEAARSVDNVAEGTKLAGAAERFAPAEEETAESTDTAVKTEGKEE